MKGLSNLSSGSEINKSLNSLAIEVLKHYEIKPEAVNVIQSGSIKTVWKVKHKNRLLCLKRLRQTYDKALFSVNAQIYIKDSSGNVPEVLLDLSGQPIIQYNDQIFVLYEWLEGRDLNFSNSQDLAYAIQGLAKFHLASKGYTPPENSRVSTKQGRWAEQYNSMKSKFIEWKQIAQDNKLIQSHSTYLIFIDSIIDIANMALEFLDKSSYKDLTDSLDSMVLCHQDYGKGNAILTDDEVVVLDLDGVTFDLPARDLRKLIAKQAENRGKWDANIINNILKWYTQVHQISEKQKEVLYIDLLFPHGFFGLVKNLFKNNKNLKSSEIEIIAKLEQSKVSMLKKLLEGCD